MITRIRASRWMKIAVVVMVFEILLPLIVQPEAHAITGGPAQPEFTTFTPIGASDMVNLFTGDFSYNIPLMDVGGYPINLSYSSTIGMEQQASCVGLGWTLNAGGAITRNMRGIPDDFNGTEEVVNTMNMKPNNTIGVTVTPPASSIEIVGLDVNLLKSYGVFHNNYKGFGLEGRFGNPLSNIVKLNGYPFSHGLGFNTQSGLEVSTTLGLANEIENNSTEAGYDVFSSSKGLSLGYSARGGLRSLSISKSAQRIDGVPEKLNIDGVSIGNTIPLGPDSYIPQINRDIQSYSLSAKLKTGGEFLWISANSDINIYFNTQALKFPVKRNPAYGYLYADRGRNNKYALHDFNREKDGTFGKHTPSLPLAQMTYDTYTVMGQGVGSMFRPHRDFATVFDAKASNSSTGGGFGGDIGGLNLIKLGGYFNVSTGDNRTGRWSGGNGSRPLLEFRDRNQVSNAISTDAGNLYEPFYMKRAGEFSVIDQNYFTQIRGFDPVRVKIDKLGRAFEDYMVRGVASTTENEIDILNNTRTARDKRNTSMSMLTAALASEGGLERTLRHYDESDNPINAVPDEPDRHDDDGRERHHISEITVTQPGGARYVYGQQTYNYLQREVSFNSEGTKDVANGTITYDVGVDNTENNRDGLDHFFNSTEMPPYANAYQLTAVLSTDYVDLDGDGPTPDDLGNYTKFNYFLLHGLDDGLYKWRNPYDKDKANFNDGLKSKTGDDKGNYIYGEKEIKMLHSIETKNYVAEFKYSDRKDAYDVIGENGGNSYTPSSGKTLKKLDKIVLYTRCDREENGTPTPLKTVHFEYDYELCQELPSNSGVLSTGNDLVINGGSELENQGGKLTLKKLYFTYEDSQKGRLSPYIFDYRNYNPNYSFRGNDRWGNYKPNQPPLYNIDDPYVSHEEDVNANGDDFFLSDEYATAWTLETIQLPSGGVISVELEADEYSFVQDKRATRMFNVVGFSESETGTPNEFLYSNVCNNHMYMHIDAPDVASADEFREKYLNSNSYGTSDYLFYKFYVELTGNTYGQLYEYVSGYAEVAEAGYNANTQRGWIKFDPVNIKDGLLQDVGCKIHPIAKTAIQFVRLNLPEILAEISPDDIDENNLIVDIVSIIPDLLSLVTGINTALRLRKVGRQVDTSRSFVRLNCPDYKKKGGGSRVSRIAISDSWGAMRGDADLDHDYGQTYDYNMISDGSGDIPEGEEMSSGVASYEPFIGNEENPLRQPHFYDEKFLAAPDNRFYKERPYGEMFFPAPSVGYSRVKVQSLKWDDVNRNATGHAIHEFYTARDFPVNIREPELERLKLQPFGLIGELLNVNIIDNLTASQGHAIEVNNMHGKSKAQYIYAEDTDENSTEDDKLISSVRYFYNQRSTNALSNEINVIDKNGNVNTAMAGVNIDMTIDERESLDETYSVTTTPNLDISIAGIFGFPVGTVYVLPGASRTVFRSIANTKVITRYGILERIEATDLGSRVVTENLAWDAETGQVLLTRTQNNFDDDVYAFTYPAHWGYDGMGQAYKNIGAEVINLGSLTNPEQFFVEGDEVIIGDDPNYTHAWVTDVGNGSVAFEDRDGNTVFANQTTRIIRSGRRNQQGAPIGTITTLSNPIQDNQLVFDDVLNAGAIEFKDEWTGFCDCDDELTSTNPYTNGEQGNYRPSRSYAYLTDRTQSNNNQSTNIRRDGVYEDFQPFWIPNPVGEWNSNNSAVWTFASEVTLVSPYGMELENRDALNRYSSADYRYNNTLPSAIASNSQYKEMGYDNFEDYDCLICPDDHFSFKQAVNLNISETQSHTGRKSIQVGPNSFVEMEKPIDDSPCN